MSKCSAIFSALVIVVSLSTTPAAAQQILGVSPELPTTADAINISVMRPSCLFTVQKSAIEGDTITLALDKSPAGCPPIAPNAGPFTVAVFSLAPLAPGGYTLILLTDGQMTDSRSILVQAPVARLSLLQGRFSVSATWENPLSGTIASANAVQLGDGSGYFWFFNAADVDLTVKMTGLNPPFWFFAASGANVQFTITVTDTWLSRTVTYRNPAGVNQNILDFTSFSS